jgi:tetratricopeptide (TPR) repeat protein
VVASVRIAERGDDLTKAGLVKRSLALYEEAANAFADAYCVQWRLAERFSAMGNVAEARKHYQIAFERMPEQFGQVASFCFGCEGVFNHPESRSVAEQVLGGLAQAEPRKPQVQYLLGQLREAQGRKAEAYRHYRAAADLDPGYLDAWEKAYSLSAAVFLTRRETDDIALRMIRLDPLRRHVSLGEQAIWDPAGLWAAYDEAGKLNLPFTEHLLPLKASAGSLEELKKRFGSETMISGMYGDDYRQRRVIPDPGQAVAGDPFIRGLVQFVVMGAIRPD